MTAIRRIRLALSIWRLEGYDGRPTPWRAAWELAGILESHGRHVLR